LDEAVYAVLASDGENDEGAGWDSDELTGAEEAYLGLNDDASPLPELLFDDTLIEAVGGVGKISAGTVPRELLSEMTRTRWTPDSVRIRHGAVPATTFNFDARRLS
jgi:hypothetical protein